MTVPPLLLVDGHNLLYRAWHGFPARILTRDKSTDRTGVFGFLALARKAQREHADGHEVFVVFDAEYGSDRRLAQDSTYKGGRAPTDPGLIESLIGIKRALDSAGIRWVEFEGCEADDVIATLTTSARDDDRLVDIMSVDKDYLQLLADPGVRLLNTGVRLDRRYLTGADVAARFRVQAHQWPDFRALTGDAADHIPGVRGIGPQTAARLLAGGRRLEQVPVSNLRPVWAGQWEQAHMWRELIRLDCKIDLPEGLLTRSVSSDLPLAARLLDELHLW